MKRLGLVLVFAAAAFGAGSDDPISPSPRHHAPISIHERHGGAVSSYNWSGYAVTGANGSVTDVKGSWIVPALVPGSCGSTALYASFWVGIDGYNSNTVEQIGTDSDCQSGKPVYYAWFEFYPHLSYTINTVKLTPGDRISAEVNYSGGKFTVTLTDESNGQTFSTSTKMNNANRSSAEWIAEAPSGGGILPLADFGTVDFAYDYTGFPCTATIGGSSPQAIGAFPAAQIFQITMVSKSGTTEASPSGLNGAGSGFTVSYY